MDKADALTGIIGIILAIVATVFLPYPDNMIALVLVVVVALLIVFFWPSGKPTLEAFIPATDPTVQVNPRRAFYHVGVLNNGNVTMRNARITVQVWDPNHMLGELAGRWDSRPEPFVAYSNPPQLSPQLLQESRQLDVIPDSRETFPVLIKYEGMPHMNIFGADSYTHPLLELPPTLPGGTYIIRILIRSENYRGYCCVRAVNSGASATSVSFSPVGCPRVESGFKAIAWASTALDTNGQD